MYGDSPGLDDVYTTSDAVIAGADLTAQPLSYEGEGSQLAFPIAARGRLIPPRRQGRVADRPGEVRAAITRSTQDPPYGRERSPQRPAHECDAFSKRLRLPTEAATAGRVIVVLAAEQATAASRRARA